MEQLKVDLNQLIQNDSNWARNFGTKPMNVQRKRYNVFACRPGAGYVFANRLEQAESFKYINKKFGKAVVDINALNEEDKQILSSECYITDENSIVICGTVGECWVVKPEKFIRSYVNTDNTPISENSAPTKEWKQYSRLQEDAPSGMGLFIPLRFLCRYRTDWGTLYINNPNSMQFHKTGDILVIGNDGSISPIAHRVFERTFNLAVGGWAQSKYGFEAPSSEEEITPQYVKQAYNFGTKEKSSCTIKEYFKLLKEEVCEEEHERAPHILCKTCIAKVGTILKGYGFRGGDEEISKDGLIYAASRLKSNMYSIKNGLRECKKLAKIVESNEKQMEIINYIEQNLIIIETMQFITAVKREGNEEKKNIHDSNNWGIMYAYCDFKYNNKDYTAIVKYSSSRLNEFYDVIITNMEELHSDNDVIRYQLTKYEKMAKYDISMSIKTEDEQQKAQYEYVQEQCTKLMKRISNEEYKDYTLNEGWIPIKLREAQMDNTLYKIGRRLYHDDIDYIHPSMLCAMHAAFVVFSKVLSDSSSQRFFELHPLEFIRENNHNGYTSITVRLKDNTKLLIYNSDKSDTDGIIIRLKDDDNNRQLFNKTIEVKHSTIEKYIEEAHVTDEEVNSKLAEVAVKRCLDTELAKVIYKQLVEFIKPRKPTEKDTIFIYNHFRSYFAKSIQRFGVNILKDFEYNMDTSDKITIDGDNDNHLVLRTSLDLNSEYWGIHVSGKTSEGTLNKTYVIEDIKHKIPKSDNNFCDSMHTLVNNMIEEDIIGYLGVNRYRRYCCKDFIETSNIPATNIRTKTTQTGRIQGVIFEVKAFNAIVAVKPEANRVIIVIKYMDANGHEQKIMDEINDESYVSNEQAQYNIKHKILGILIKTLPNSAVKRVVTQLAEGGVTGDLDRGALIRCLSYIDTNKEVVRFHIFHNKDEFYVLYKFSHDGVFSIESSNTVSPLKGSDNKYNISQLESEINRFLNVAHYLIVH